MTEGGSGGDPDFAAWSEWLWEDYAGVTFDTETGTYRLPDGTVYEPTEK